MATELAKRRSGEFDLDSKLRSTNKFLNLILRHKPQEIGLNLDAQGWAVPDVSWLGRRTRMFAGDWRATV